MTTISSSETRCLSKKKEFDKCKATGKDCTKYEVNYAICLAITLTPKEEKDYTTCNRSIMGSGAYMGRKDCNEEYGKVKAALRKFYAENDLQCPI